MMNRITMHHTGGTYTPNSTDLKHYHFVVDGGGHVHNGKFPPEANAIGKHLRPGQYAAHTASLNTGNIGVAMACMRGGEWGRPAACEYFPKREQVMGMARLVARLAIQYNIQPEYRHVLSHAEVEPTLGVKQAQKWDFDYDPMGEMTTRSPRLIGDSLRAMIREEIRRTATPIPHVKAPVGPLTVQGDRGEWVILLQELLNKHMRLALAEDGIFGPRTRAVVIAFQSSHGLLQDGKVGPATWTALHRA